MDVLNLLRSRSSWFQSGGGGEARELQELKVGPKRAELPAAISMPSAMGKQMALPEREPLGACVPNHPRFGAGSPRDVRDDVSATEYGSATLDTVSNCSSGKRGPRATPCDMAPKKSMGNQASDLFKEQGENQVLETGWSDNASEDESESGSDEGSDEDEPSFHADADACLSVRIATNLLPEEMHASTPPSVHEGLTEEADESPLADVIKAEPSFGGSAFEGAEGDHGTSFSPPPAQAIKRNLTPVAYPRILSVMSSETLQVQQETPVMSNGGDSQTSDQGRKVRDEPTGNGDMPRTIRAARTDGDNQGGVNRVGSLMAAPSAFLERSPERDGGESSPQLALRRERQRKEQEAEETVQEEMQALMEALIAKNPALVAPPQSSRLSPPLESGELECLRARCSQQETELVALRGKLDDIQALCGSAQARCGVLERENQQMQTQVATLKWQLNLQEDFRFLTPPPNLSCDERELWRKKLLQERLMPSAEKAPGTARKLTLEEPPKAHPNADARPPRSVSPDISAAYLAAVADARNNPTPEKLAQAAKARNDLSWLFGARKPKVSVGPFVPGGSEGDLEGFPARGNYPVDGERNCEAQSPRSMIRNLSASSEYAQPEALSVNAPLSEGLESSQGSRASFHTPLARGDTAATTPVAQSPLVSLESPFDSA